MTIAEFIQKYFPGDVSIAPDWPVIPADEGATAFEGFSEADLQIFGELLDKALGDRFAGGFFVSAFNGSEGIGDSSPIVPDYRSPAADAWSDASSSLVDALQALPGVESFNVDLAGYGGYLTGNYLPGVFLYWGLGSSFSSALMFLYVPARR
jgi:hypothetical protein